MITAFGLTVTTRFCEFTHELAVNVNAYTVFTAVVTLLFVNVSLTTLTPEPVVLPLMAVFAPRFHAKVVPVVSVVAV